MLVTEKTIMIVTNKNKIFEYIAPSIEEAVNRYIKEVLVFKRGFTISESAWQALMANSKLETHNGMRPLTVFVELVNGLCRRRSDRIARVVTNYLRAYPDCEYIADNGVVYGVSEGKAYAEVVGYSGLGDAVKIEREFEDLPVTHIAAGAFERSAIKSIIIPNTITNIDIKAFYECFNLNKIIYCGTAETWNDITIDPLNEPFIDAEVQYHELVNNVCTYCTEMHEHKAVDVRIENVVEATCTAKGRYDTVQYCSCGQKLGSTTTYTDMKDHVRIIDQKVDPTCEKTGLTAGEHCASCKEVFKAQEVIPATGHVAGEVVIENDSRTGDDKCSQNGTYEEVTRCVKCNKELKRETVTVTASGHKAAAAVKEKEVAATCTTKGSYDLVTECSVCGKELSRETKSIEALDHAFGEWKVTKTATCCYSGTKERTCSRCGKKETATIASTQQHVSTYEKETRIEPTCARTGTKTITTYCSATDKAIGTKTESIPATGLHFWTGEEGRQTCKVCGTAKFEEFEEFG